MMPRSLLGNDQDTARSLHWHCPVAAEILLWHRPDIAGPLLGHGSDFCPVAARQLLGKCSGTAVGQSAAATTLLDKGIVSNKTERISISESRTG